MDFYYILIDLEDGQTHLREFPIGICCECDGLCAPRQTMCNRCNHVEAVADEVRMLEELFENTDIVLP